VLQLSLLRHGRLTVSVLPSPTGQNSLHPPHLPIDFTPNSPYAKSADEFVRLSCREHTGWRRDEWAYSPLFICSKGPGLGADSGGREAPVKATR
jgi:hypothetical protein